jgi:hypothetical protein
MTAFAGRMIYSGRSSPKIWVSWFGKSFLYVALLELWICINKHKSTDKRPSWKHIVAEQVKTFRFYTSQFSVLYSQEPTGLQAWVILTSFTSSNTMSSRNCVRFSFLCYAWCAFRPYALPWFNVPHNIRQKNKLWSSLLCNFCISSITSCLLGQTFFSSLCANTTNWCSLLGVTSHITDQYKQI